MKPFGPVVNVYLLANRKEKEFVNEWRGGNFIHMMQNVLSREDNNTLAYNVGAEHPFKDAIISLFEKIQRFEPDNDRLTRQETAQAQYDKGLKQKGEEPYPGDKIYVLSRNQVIRFCNDMNEHITKEREQGAKR